MLNEIDHSPADLRRPSRRSPEEQRFHDEGGFAGWRMDPKKNRDGMTVPQRLTVSICQALSCDPGGFTMKKTYLKPVLIKRGKLSQVTAVTNGAGSGPVE
jgi:hypothetical protein